MPLVHGQQISGEELEREISSWNAIPFARLCNATAWALTWRTAQTLPAFSERVIVGDNGIDAEWWRDLSQGEQGNGPFLRPGTNVFQYKKREIATQRRSETVAGLSSILRGAALEVERRTGKTLATYTLFTNVDLTTEQHGQLRTAILKGIVESRVQVAIVGAADLAAILNDLPHIRSAFFATGAFRTWGQSWHAHQQVSAFAQTGLVGRDDTLATVRGWIRNPAVRVIAVSGAHMMGKTRVILEATRTHDASFVEALDRQALTIDQLRRLTSPSQEVVALVNEPDVELAAELAREALATDGLKLIFSLSTADAMPAPSFRLDERVQSLSLPALDTAQSEALLNTAKPNLDISLRSWIVEHAGGVPGVILAAAQEGMGLRRDGGNFLNQVARGFELKAEHLLSGAEQGALRALSLMSHVGIAGAAKIEAEIVAVHFGIELHVILDAIERLHAAGLVRLDGSYAEVVPPPLANRLAGRMIRGRLSAVKACLHQLPEQGRRRLLKRLVLLHGEEAQGFWDELLGDTGPFTTLDGIVQDSDLFRFAASANSVRVGRILNRLLESASVEARFAITGEKRRDLFYACEEMLFRERSGEYGLRCLALLGEAENERWSNNSSGVFKEAFHPLQPQVPLPLTSRLDILRDLFRPFRSEVLATLVVEASASVLESDLVATTRHSGAADPLGRTPMLTWPDVWQYQTDCVDLLVAAIDDGRARVRKAASAVIARALTNFVAYGHAERGLAHVQNIVNRVIAGDCVCDPSQLADRLAWCRFALRDDTHGGPVNNANAIAGVTALLAQLNNSDYVTRMRRWVGGWSLDIEDTKAPAAAGERAIAGLAGEACAQPGLLTDEMVSWLCTEAEQAGRFWHELGRQDAERKFETLARRLATRDDGAHGFMLYVLGWCERDQDQGRTFFEGVVGDEGTSPRAILFGAFEIDAPDVGAQRIVELLRSGRIEPTKALVRLQAGRWLHKVSEPALVSVLELVAGPEFENGGQLPELLEMRFYFTKLEPGILADFAWKCLEAHPTLNRHLGDYYSDQLACRLVEFHPDRAFALLDRCITDERPGDRWKPFLSGSNRLAFWERLCSIDRGHALVTILDVASRGGPGRSTLRWWLPNLIDAARDGDFLLSYAGRGEAEALAVAHAITGGRPGFWSVVFGLIERYPTTQHLKAELEARVVQRGQAMMGPFSDRYREWLTEVEAACVLPNATSRVRAWLSDFAGRLRLGLEEQLRREADERVNRG